MITYDPFWKTLKQKGFTTYTLRVKYNMSSSTIQRLRNNESITTRTLDDLCIILDCNVEDIVLYICSK